MFLRNANIFTCWKSLLRYNKHNNPLKVYISMFCFVFYYMQRVMATIITIKLQNTFVPPHQNKNRNKRPIPSFLCALLYSQPQITTNPFSIFIQICLFWTLQIKRIIQYVVFCAFFTQHVSISPTFIAYISSSFLFITELYSNVWLYHILFLISEWTFELFLFFDYYE